MITAHVTCVLITVTGFYTLDTQPFFNHFDTTYNIFIRFISIELHLIPVVVMFPNPISDTFQKFKACRVRTYKGPGRRKAYALNVPFLSIAVWKSMYVN